MKRAGRKNTDRRARYMVSEKELDKMRQEVSLEAVAKTGMLYCAALAEMGWDEEQIADLFETVSRYAQYVDDKIVKLREVQEIIERKTGITIKGGW